MSAVFMNEQNINEILDRVCNLDKGLKSGFFDFDYVTTGFQKGNLYVIGGRPAMGKTMFAMNVVKDVALKQNKPVLYISLDQSTEMVVTKLLQVVSAQDVRKLHLRDINEDEMTILRNSVKEVGNSSLIVDDSPGMPVEMIREALEGEYQNLGIELIVIDYLQLMRTRQHYQSRQEEIAKISRELKSIAQEFNLSIIAISQLSRFPEMRPDHRPMLSDLRESGVIEEVADCVFFIYRDEYYDSNSEYKGIAEIMIGKNNFGPRGTIELHFVPEKGRFENINRFHD